MRPSECREPSLIDFKRGFARCVAKGLGRHRAENGKRVFDTVLQFVVGEVERFARPMLRSDIVADDEHATDLAVEINRPVAVGPPHVLAAAVTRDRYQLVDIPCPP